MRATYATILFIAAAATAPALGAGHEIGTFFNAYCIQCHGPDKASAKLRLDQLKIDDVSQAGTWRRVFESLDLREMPPEDARKHPSPEESAQWARWVYKQFEAKGQPWANRSQSPGYGNYLQHKDLFDSSAAYALASGPRLWRITPSAFDELVERLGGRNLKVRDNPFSLDEGQGSFRDFAIRYTVDGPTTEQLADLALELAILQTGGSLETDVRPNSFTGTRSHKTHSMPDAFATVLDQKQKADRAAYRSALSLQIQMVLRRAPRPDELDKLVSFAMESDEKLGRPHGFRAALAAVILNPEAVYRFEGVAPGREHLMSRREVARAISYALLDLEPSPELLAAFESEPADRPVSDIVRGQATRLLADKKRTRPKVLRFFQEFFDYQKAATVFKDKELFTDHNPQALVSDTDRLIEYVLDQDKDVYRQLLTTDKAFVLYGGKEGKPRFNIGNEQTPTAHTAYGLPPDWKYTADQPIELPKDQRAGILTQPAWLVAHSSNFENDPIRRGKWIRYNLLGGTVPDVPINVDAKLPEDEHLTLRQRMKGTEAAACWKCHQNMNPLGLPFESFDHFGRYRMTELGKPVVTTGRIDGSDDAAAEGSVENSIEMIHRLAGSTRVRQVFVRHVFRYFTGRNETLGDARTLQRADLAYVESGGSMNALITELLCSDSFLLRPRRYD